MLDTFAILQILAGIASSRAPTAPGNRQPNTGVPSIPDAFTAGPVVVDQSSAIEATTVAQRQSEEGLRAQLEQTDLYDLSGEKAAAEALRRDDAFKEQQIQEKAQQTKELFAEQDRKQQESLQEMQRQADAQLAEKSQKEFWDAKQAQEMQAGMDKELLGLHESARQEHQQWRAGFTEGICRDDATALVNNQIDGRVGAYKDRLTDLGSNAVDASQTAQRYKVKLESEGSVEIDQRTAESHAEHFPEYQGIEQPKPEGPAPRGEIPSSGFGPFEGGPQGGYGLEDLVNKKGDFGPWDATAGPTPDKPFMRSEMDPRGDGTDAPPGWFKNVDELPKQDAPPGWFKNVDAPPAGAKDNLEGWMKPIDPPLGEQLASAIGGAAERARQQLDPVVLGEKLERGMDAVIGPEAIHLTLDVIDEHHSIGAMPGLPHDVANQLGEQFETIVDHGMVGVKASVQMEMEKAKELLEKMKDGAVEMKDQVKAAGEKLAEQTKVAGEKFMDTAGDFTERAKVAAEKLAEQARAVGETVKESAQEVASNFKISSRDAIEQAVQADLKKAETTQNKVLEEVHQQDVSLAEKYRQRQLDLRKSAEEIASASTQFDAHAKKVEEQMQPVPTATPQPTPAVSPTPTPTPTHTPTPTPSGPHL